VARNRKLTWKLHLFIDHILWGLYHRIELNGVECCRYTRNGKESKWKWPWFNFTHVYYPGTFLQKLSNINIPVSGYSVPELGFGPACSRIRSSRATTPTRSPRLVADQAVKKVSWGCVTIIAYTLSLQSIHELLTWAFGRRVTLCRCCKWKQQSEVFLLEATTHPQHEADGENSRTCLSLLQPTYTASNAALYQDMR
jgi:hypothetical protein